MLLYTPRCFLDTVHTNTTLYARLLSIGITDSQLIFSSRVHFERQLFDTEKCLFSRILWVTICQNCNDFPPFSLLRVTKTIFHNWTPCVAVAAALNKWLFRRETLNLVLLWNCQPCLRRDIYIFYFRRWKLKFFPHMHIAKINSSFSTMYSRDLAWSVMK